VSNEKRALVTGGAGFIGSYLCEGLDGRGYKISVIDNLFRGRYENIARLFPRRSSAWGESEGEINHFYKLDLSKPENVGKVAKILAEEQPALIFHYAAINGTQYFYDIPCKVMEDNTLMTWVLMKALRLAKADLPDWKPRLIYASSSETYGEPLELPSKENGVTYVKIGNERDSYAASKIASEFFVKLGSQEAGTEWIILRLFNVYGPRMVGTKYGQVIPEFIKRLRDGENPLKIIGNGEQRRSFCFVSDNVRLTLDLAEGKTANDVFNVGNTEEISIKDLAEIIMKKLGKEPRFEFLPERKGDHLRRCPDITKLRAAVEVSGFLSLDKGLDIMLESSK
jgi:nucleoside-diphosphate-sugar epimerase